MAAACYPDAQACVQGELDEVVGQDRSMLNLLLSVLRFLTWHSVLSFGDLDMLPQLQAFILEALRWRPVTPLGMVPTIHILAMICPRAQILRVRVCTPCHEGYHLGMYFSMYGGSDDHDVTEGSMHPCRRDCLRMSSVRPSCHTVHCFSYLLQGDLARP